MIIYLYNLIHTYTPCCFLRKNPRLPTHPHLPRSPCRGSRRALRFDPRPLPRHRHWATSWGIHGQMPEFSEDGTNNSVTHSLIL